MPPRFLFLLASLLAAMICGTGTARPASLDLLPPADKLKHDRPRVLLRPKATPHAVSLEQLRLPGAGEEYRRLFEQLLQQPNAACQALVWLITGDDKAARQAIARLQSYRLPEKFDTFHTYHRLTEFGLAYDWLYNHPEFTPAIRAQVRKAILPLAQAGLKQTDDHIFHNYIWMSAGGTALWALATAGEDAESDRLYEAIRQRFNTGLLPAWQYLDGLPSEPMGYWSLYVLTPGVFTLLAAQSAAETDLLGRIKAEYGDFLNRHLENLVHSVLPDMRYIPWGDLQGGPNGGITHEMAGAIDALYWATAAPHAGYLSGWLAAKRGSARFYGPTVMCYFIYTRNLKSPAAQPSFPLPLSFLAGGANAAHFIARSSWDDNATIVTLRCTDHYGDHHHYDQGSFIIYRHGLLAVDPPVYPRIRGPQQPTDCHNTLLLGGVGQRACRGQWFRTVEDFQRNLNAGQMLETGDMPFYKESGTWAAAAAQFAQAYDPQVVQSCVRQLLFLRPDKVLVVDQLSAPAGKTLPEVQWLLQCPAAPKHQQHSVWTSNGRSWLRCTPVYPGGKPPTVEPTEVGTHRVSYTYRGADSLVLVHLLEVGDGQQPSQSATIELRVLPQSVQAVLAGKHFRFARTLPFAVSQDTAAGP